MLAFYYGLQTRLSLTTECQRQADPASHQAGHHSKEEKSRRQWFDKDKYQGAQERRQRQLAKLGHSSCTQKRGAVPPLSCASPVL